MRELIVTSDIATAAYTAQAVKEPPGQNKPATSTSQRTLFKNR
jgi:hypothetical protein